VDLDLGACRTKSLFGWLVDDGWGWFILREEYRWLVAGGWFVVSEKYCWLVADKPSEQGVNELQLVRHHPKDRRGIGQCQPIQWPSTWFEGNATARRSTTGHRDE
jgi:hypothetical protein